MLFIIKLTVAISIVVGLSLLAEYVSPRVAGILSGYPTGSAITLFFFGLELGPQFASDSAIFNMIGMTASLSFVYFYYVSSKYFNKYSILLSSLFSILGYFLVIYVLHFIQLNKFIAILIPIVFAFLYIYLFKNIKNIIIENKVKLDFKILFMRAFFSALIILFITSIPKFVGSTWAGLFSAFPTTLFPLILIVHFTYSKEHVHTIIKNVPIGMFSLIIYSLLISIAYPLYGIYWGTLLSFGAATIYLIIYSQLKSIILKNSIKINSIK